ncbi:hypothetical protein PUN28_015036 [Cardiocondyla obscurior]|uniref:Uncharacterized protein n=1 Tax=Cardiocondyla obscurior TaxID=286306 RepID=A0AAW2F0C4_9HYME
MELPLRLQSRRAGCTGPPSRVLKQLSSRELTLGLPRRRKSTITGTKKRKGEEQGNCSEFSVICRNYVNYIMTSVRI